ncbi:MAG: geranylgeranylglycerol-phosphate geranylgeranyltransferase [Bacteroidota bacterium]
MIKKIRINLNAEKLKAVGQLVRLPNILIIILTQVLLRYCILVPLIYSRNQDTGTALADFIALVAATVLIAIGGYVINDYFDVKIDSVNRPDKLVVNRLISARGAIKLHILLNVLAMFIGFYLSWRVKAVSFGLIFPFLSGVLWIYSAKYKRVFFWGNFLVAALSSFVILIVWLFEFFWLRIHALSFGDALPYIRSTNSIFLGYAIFAFLVSMIREIVKDMEDTEGDTLFGCRTLPVVAGMQYTRYIVAAVIVATILLLAYAQFILYRLGLMMVFWYFVVTVQAGAFYLLLSLFRAREKQDYHFLSSLCKLIMVAGIMSLEIIYISV